MFTMLRAPARCIRMHDTPSPTPLFASMFEAAGTMFCLPDRQRRIAYLNPFGAERLGTEVHAALGKDFVAEFLPVSVRERMAELLTLAAAKPGIQDTVFPSSPAGGTPGCWARLWLLSQAGKAWWVCS